MDLMYIFIFTAVIQETAGEFLHQEKITADKVLYNDDEPSLLQCVQRCRFIDKSSAVEFQDSKCRCVTYKEKTTQDDTLASLFITKLTVDLTWSGYGACSVTCGEGKQTRTRLCNNPVPRYCVGSRSEQRNCNVGNCPENLALNKPASQSSTGGQRIAKQGNDGDVTTIAVTRFDQPDGWWQVDLERSSTIHHLNITLGAKTLRDGDYRDMSVITREEGILRWNTCAKIKAPLTTSLMITCDPNANKAQFVRIENSKFLVLAEVMIYGFVN